MTEKTAEQRLSDAYAASPVTTAGDRRQRDLAATYRPDPTMERLIALRDSERADDRALFARTITPTLRMSLGSYEIAKRAHQEEHGQ